MEEVKAYITKDGELFLNENYAIEHENKTNEKKTLNALEFLFTTQIDPISVIYFSRLVYDNRDIIMQILTNPDLPIEG